MEPSVKHVSGVLECLEHGGWESCLRAISLGKTLFKCRALHLGFAQIAIGPPPHAQPFFRTNLKFVRSFLHSCHQSILASLNTFLYTSKCILELQFSLQTKPLKCNISKSFRHHDTTFRGTAVNMISPFVMVPVGALPGARVNSLCTKCGGLW